MSSLTVETNHAGDWAEYTDETSGSVYYYNSVTGETSWENPCPQSEASAAEPATESVPVAVDPADVPENWELVEDTGGNYYYNSVTQLTQWDMPACMGAPPADASGTVPAPVELASEPAPSKVSAGSDSEGASRPRASSTSAATNKPFSSTSEGSATSGGESSDGGSGRSGAKKSGSFLDVSSVRRKSRSSQMGDSRRGSVRKQYKNSVLIVDKSAASGVASKSTGETWEALAARIVAEADGVTAKLAALPYRNNPGYIDEVLALTRECSLNLYAFRQFKFPDPVDTAEAQSAITRLLSWQQDLIKTCLCKAISTHNELVSESIFLFRHVTGYMKDRIVTLGGAQGGKQNGYQHEQNIALKILELMLLTPSKELCDELYCQICKQIANNPNMESTIRGWQLLNICLASFPPSTHLAPFIINFASQHIEDYFKSVPGGEPKLNSSSSLIAKLAYNIVYYTPIAMRFPPAHLCRKELPGTMELEGLERAEGINIRVYFIDGKYTMTKVSSWSTAQDVEDLISSKEKLNLGKFKNLTDGAKLFSLYETTSTLTSSANMGSSSLGTKHHHGGKHTDTRTHREEEVDSRALADHERLVDVLALWQRASQDPLDDDDDVSNYGDDHDQHAEEIVKKKKSKSKHHHTGHLPIYKFVFKRKFYFDSNQLNNNYSEDYTTIELSYHEVVKDVLHGYYPYTEHDAYLLAALQLQHDEGDYDPARETQYFRHQPNATQTTIEQAPGASKSSTTVVSHHTIPISMPLLLHYVCKSFLVGRPVDTEEPHSVSTSTKSSRHMNQAAHELYLGEVVANIINTYKRLVGMNCLQCRLMYLDYIRSWKLFGCRYFFVETQNGNSAADSGPANQVLLAINYKCITLMEPVTKDFLTEYNYNVVLSWGYSLNSLLLVIGLSSAKQVKLYFKTLEGKLINELIEMYSKQYKASAPAVST